MEYIKYDFIYHIKMTIKFTAEITTKKSKTLFRNIKKNKLIKNPLEVIIYLKHDDRHKRLKNSIFLILLGHQNINSIKFANTNYDLIKILNTTVYGTKIVYKNGIEIPIPK